MKIQGPGGPPRPPELDPAEGATPGGRGGGAGFADKLGAPTPAVGPGATEAGGAAGVGAGPLDAAGAGVPAGGAGAARAGGAGAADPVSAVTAELRAGAITPRQAVDRLLDLAISSAGPLPPKVQARLRADLEDLVRNDPALASRARRLGVPEEDGE